MLDTPPIAEDIAELNRRLYRGELRRETLLLQIFEAMQSDRAANVFVRSYRDAALASARYADAAQAAGVRQHPLAGLPVTIKDLYDVAGETTTAGSIVCQGEPAALADAPAVARLRQAGAAIIGKTNMTEFAFSGVGINPHYGTPHNPSDAALARIPGGSSSGAAVSVALGLAVAGLGSDTGGSIRIPAALCGLTGFKNTQHRVPRQGALELSRTLDTVCAMTRSVDDCLMIDGLLSGAPLLVRQRSVRGLRLALPRTLMLDSLDKTVAQAFERALGRLAACGAQVVEIELKELAEIAQINAPGGFSAIEAAAVHQARLARGRDRFDARVAQRIALGQGVSAQQYLQIQDHRRDWINRVSKALEAFDALICPTVPIVAPEIEPLRSSDDQFFKTNGLLLRNTFAINFLDGCSFTLPCQASDELPVGLMLSSVADDDARLAGVALAVEAALR